MSDSSNTSETTGLDYTSYEDHIAGVNLGKYLSPLFLILGTIGNILSIFILSRKNIRKSTCSVYLIVLACSDLAVLYTGLLRQWIIAISGVDVRSYGSTICKLHTWIVYVSLDYSAWILVAVTAERVALVWFPHSAKVKCTKKTAAWTLGSLLFCLMMVNSHILYGMQDSVITVGNTTELKRCDYINKEYEDFFGNTWPWLDLVIFCGFPFVCLLSGNVLIITKVVSSHRTTKRQIAPHDPKFSNAVQKSPISSMSVIMVTLNSVFLLCTTPISIYLIGYTHWDSYANEVQKAQLSLGWAVVYILMYGNNTFNFILYCLSGTRFRNEVKVTFMKMIGRKQMITEQQQQQLRRNVTTRSHISATPTPPMPTERSRVAGDNTKNNGNLLTVKRYTDIAHSTSSLQTSNL